MWISRCVCLFLIYSFLGWVYETIFCTIKDGRWENRGFLYGPVVPLYGTGAVAISLLLYLCSGKNIVLDPWLIFMVSVIGSAVLEYVTSWTMEKLFHALWWDYSRYPLNIHGRVSLFTSLGFGLAGLFVVYYIAPFCQGLLSMVPDIVIELLSLFMVFVFAVDITFTVTALYHFDQIVIRVDDSFNQSMSNLVGNVTQKTNQAKYDILAKRTIIMNHMSDMSRFSRKTINRIYIFKDNNKRIETLRNNLLSVIRPEIEKMKEHFEELEGEVRLEKMECPKEQETAEMYKENKESWSKWESCQNEKKGNDMSGSRH